MPLVDLSPGLLAGWTLGAAMRFVNVAGAIVASRQCGARPGRPR